MDIDLFYLHQKLNREVKERFAFEAGISTDVPPPLATFTPDDPQDFIR
jgi:hypothetical protein